MLGPHIFAGLPVSSLNSFTSSWQSLSCCPLAAFFRKAATLTRVGLVLFAGMGTKLRFPETQAGFLECRTQFRDCVGSHAMQFANLRLGFLRDLSESGEAGAFERSPGGRRQADEESFLRFALRLHTSF